MRRLVVCVLAALAVCAAGGLVAPLASADSTSGILTSASFQPVGPQRAGSGDATNIDLSFNYADSSDTAKSLSVTFPPGFLAAPAAVSAMCTPGQLAAFACPAASQVGFGEATVNTIIGTQTAGVAIYLMPAPSSASVVGVGVILSADVLGLPITLTTSGTAGFTIGSGGQPQLLITLPDLPASATVPVLGAVAIQLEQLTLTINGAAPSGKQFLYLPTSCGSAAAGLASTSVEGASGSATTSFTPTGCPLAYGGGGVSSAAQAVDGDFDAAFQTTVTFPVGADTTGVKVGIPGTALRANPIYAGLNCPTAPPFTGCTPIGTVSVTTPLLSSPLTGTAYLTGTVAGFGLGLAFPPPYSDVSLAGSVTSAGGITTVLFTGIPDLPLTKLTLALTGSSTSAFITSCGAGTQTLTAALSGAGGAGTLNTSTAITITGCPAVGPGGGESQVANYGKGALPSHFTPPTPAAGSTATRARVSSATLSAITTSRPSLSFTLRAGSSAKLRSFVLTLPSGMSFVSSALARTLRASVAVSRRLSGQKLSVTLKRPASAISLRIAAGGLRESAALAGAARRHPQAKLAFRLAVSPVGTVVNQLKLNLR